MKPTIKFDRTLVAVLVDEVVHVMLELAAPPAASVKRAPLDVAVVLDRSGSMIGEPLEAVTSATAQLLRLAGPDDRIAVVSFDDNVQLVLPLAHHEPDGAGAAVRAIRSGGSTNLSGGWLKLIISQLSCPRSFRNFSISAGLAKPPLPLLMILYSQLDIGGQASRNAPVEASLFWGL